MRDRSDSLISEQNTHWIYRQRDAMNRSIVFNITVKYAYDIF